MSRNKGHRARKGLHLAITCCKRPYEPTDWGNSRRGVLNLSIPGKPVAYKYRLLPINHGLLWGIACHFKQLGFPGKQHLFIWGRSSVLPTVPYTSCAKPGAASAWERQQRRGCPSGEQWVLVGRAWRLSRNLESQVTQKNTTLYPCKVAPNCQPLAFQVGF